MACQPVADCRLPLSLKPGVPESLRPLCKAPLPLKSIVFLLACARHNLVFSSAHTAVR